MLQICFYLSNKMLWGSYLTVVGSKKKSKPQSKQAPICTTIGMKFFSLFKHQATSLKQLFKEENQQRPEV
jgi:hypothetical protein